MSNHRVPVDTKKSREIGKVNYVDKPMPLEKKMSQVISKNMTVQEYAKFLLHRIFYWGNDFYFFTS